MARILQKMYLARDNSSALIPEDSSISRVYALGGSYKRLIDIVLASVALVLAIPIFAIVAVAIKLCDRGPIFFKHERVGLGGKTFSCMKFRTMRVRSEIHLMQYLEADPTAAEEWNSKQKLSNDPRITAIGGSLRRSSIDELPQLINVLKGDMSLVGPRPVTTEEMARYGRDASYYLSARPGLTGAWQVSGRNDVPYAQRVLMDAEYCRTWSLFGDISIMLRTVPALFAQRGSY
ncbi:sugar transferase [Rhizobium sp. RAF56]|uniref:sugar transferase n=1 Tax=Rhizobium sp. RAF56 TaxID=3233062 RepID=UPI003F9D109C